jgi:hypothetical protein
MDRTRKIDSKEALGYLQCMLEVLSFFENRKNNLDEMSVSVELIRHIEREFKKMKQ